MNPNIETKPGTAPKTRVPFVNFPGHRKCINQYQDFRIDSIYKVATLSVLRSPQHRPELSALGLEIPKDRIQGSCFGVALERGLRTSINI